MRNGISFLYFYIMTAVRPRRLAGRISAPSGVASVSEPKHIIIDFGVAEWQLATNGRPKSPDRNFSR